ncbi:SubName: Full=Related to nuclear transport factor {ECO:0000313/EMBL:CCA66868.1} [Serendipita indica DSM 11827]|nr:SubName: Full=Related to nuclear transport factor {ECO:0000313/EMBL:CCA66868.1} [Serendipita indica DSM 11827]
MADINAVARQFAEYYYGKFSANRADLVPLYREQSMLTFESSQHIGVGNIAEKYTVRIQTRRGQKGLPFGQVAARISTLDAQPTPTGICIFVTGELQLEDQEQPLRFCQCFNLVSESGSYWVLNDIFRLNYG